VINIRAFNNIVFSLLSELNIGFYLFDNENKMIFRNETAEEYNIENELNCLLKKEATKKIDLKDDVHILICKSVFDRNYKEIIVIPIDKVLHSRYREAFTKHENIDAIINYIYDEVFVTDAKGIVLNVNKACERLYNKAAWDLVGHNVKTLEKEGFFSPSITDKVVKTKKSQTVMQTTKNGKKILVTATPIVDDQNRVVKVVCNSRDLTELIDLRKQLEEKEVIVKQYSKTIKELKVEGVSDEKLFYISSEIDKIHHLIKKVAPSDINILLLGESGVGKTMIAKVIHNDSSRRDRPFQVINCSAIPETLLESELFGYEKGAYTGALKQGKPGLFELTEGGTIFLDEIGELSMQLQTKLLQVIQEKKYRKIGGLKEFTTDFRLITATNQDLTKKIAYKEFREDFFYRINGISIVIPPLRERKDDIGVLSSHFMGECNAKYGYNKRLSYEVLDVFYRFDWPGNIRQLKNLIERLCLISEYDLIMLNDLPEVFLSDDRVKRSTRMPERVYKADEIPKLNMAIEQLEEELVNRAYSKYKNSYKVAEVLGISQPTAFRKIKKYINS